MAIIKQLFKAYEANDLPAVGGYIVSVHYDSNSTYTRYEVVSFGSVKDIYLSEDGLVFQADGHKLFILVEPADYNQKHVEPAYRTALSAIPYRFKEVNTFVSKRQDRIMVGKQPVVTYSSFTIVRPSGNDLCYIFLPSDDIQPAMVDYFTKSLNKEARVPRSDAEQVATDLIRPALAEIVPESGGFK